MGEQVTFVYIQRDSCSSQKKSGAQAFPGTSVGYERRKRAYLTVEICHEESVHSGRHFPQGKLDQRKIEDDDT